MARSIFSLTIACGGSLAVIAFVTRFDFGMAFILFVPTALIALVAAVDGPKVFKEPSALVVSGACGGWGLMYCVTNPSLGAVLSVACLFVFGFLIGKEVDRRRAEGTP